MCNTTYFDFALALCRGMIFMIVSVKEVDLKMYIEVARYLLQTLLVKI